jgi:hypothetical protein
MAPNSTALEFIPEHLQEYITVQNPELYTAMDHAAWRFIMRVSKAFFSKTAHPLYLQGLEVTGISTERIPLISEMDAALKNRLIAECKFLRAHSYLLLVQWFGDLALVTKVLTADEYYAQARQPKEKSSQQKLHAIERLPLCPRWRWMTTPLRALCASCSATASSGTASQPCVNSQQVWATNGSVIAYDLSLRQGFAQPCGEVSCRTSVASCRSIVATSATTSSASSRLSSSPPWAAPGSRGRKQPNPWLAGSASAGPGQSSRRQSDPSSMVCFALVVSRRRVQNGFGVYEL